MSVYVDDPMPCTITTDWPFQAICHLLADTTMELHAFARRLYLRRSWYQSNTSLPHYTIPPRKRRQAIRLGAIRIDKGEVFKRFCAARKEKDNA